jgi:hypothetical protein
LCARLPRPGHRPRAAAHPRFPLNALATELRNARSGLDAFAGRDPSTDLRAVFSWSHRTLDPAALRLFRLLGLHPAPDIAAPAAASLAGLPRGRVRVLLAELAQANLISEPAPGRFTLHDLLRTHAIELADIRQRGGARGHRPDVDHFRTPPTPRTGAASASTDHPPRSDMGFT